MNNLCLRQQTMNNVQNVQGRRPQSTREYLCIKVRGPQWPRGFKARLIQIEWTSLPQTNPEEGGGLLRHPDGPQQRKEAIIGHRVPRPPTRRVAVYCDVLNFQKIAREATFGEVLTVPPLIVAT